MKANNKGLAKRNGLMGLSMRDCGRTKGFMGLVIMLLLAKIKATQAIMLREIYMVMESCSGMIKGNIKDIGNVTLGTAMEHKQKWMVQ